MNLSLSVDTKTNLSFWTTKPDHFVESISVRSSFLVRIFSRIWTEYGGSEHCFVILIPLYCKFIVKSWLNDCEDMKLVISTHVVLSHYFYFHYIYMYIYILYINKYIYILYIYIYIHIYIYIYMYIYIRYQTIKHAN